MTALCLRAEPAAAQTPSSGASQVALPSDAMQRFFLNTTDPFAVCNDGTSGAETFRSYSLHSSQPRLLSRCGPPCMAAHTLICRGRSQAAVTTQSSEHCRVCFHSCILLPARQRQRRHPVADPLSGRRLVHRHGQLPAAHGHGALAHVLQAVPGALLGERCLKVTLHPQSPKPRRHFRTSHRQVLCTDVYVDDGDPFQAGLPPLEELQSCPAAGPSAAVTIQTLASPPRHLVCITLPCRRS